MQAYTAASQRPTWDRSQAQKCRPGSMTSGRACPGRASPCTHCEAYLMQQHPSCSADGNSRPGRLGQGHPLHPIARPLSAWRQLCAACVWAILASVQMWCSDSPLSDALDAFEIVHLFVDHVSVDYREYTGNFGRMRSACWPMQSRITGFAFPSVCQRVEMRARTATQILPFVMTRYFIAVQNKCIST